MQNILYDKNRRPILKDDVLKVFHFIGRRKKRHFMYKIAGEYVGCRLVIHHLPQTKGCYSEKADGRVMESIEIVQGYGNVKTGFSFENRKKRGES